MRKIVSLLTVLLLLAALPCPAFAEEDIQALVNDLPAVEDIQAMDLEDQKKVYLQVQEVYGLYAALGEDRLKIAGGEEKFDVLFSWFNTQLMPLEPAEEVPEQEAGSRLLNWAGIAAAVLLLLAFQKKKRMG